MLQKVPPDKVNIRSEDRIPAAELRDRLQLWIMMEYLLSRRLLKVVSATFLIVYFVCLKERTCETRKNVFYFASKALFVLEIIRF